MKAQLRRPAREASLVLASRRALSRCPHLQLGIEVTFRLCQRADLRALEWHGMYREQRRVIESAFRRQQRGQNLMLLAEANRQIVGQVWLDLERTPSSNAALVWAMRVVPCLQGLGIGSQLLAVAIELAVELGFEMAQLAVEQDNLRAQQLYRRCGFIRVGAFTDEDSPPANSGRRKQRLRPHFVMRRKLSPGATMPARRDRS